MDEIPSRQQSVTPAQTVQNSVRRSIAADVCTDDAKLRIRLATKMWQLSRWGGGKGGRGRRRRVSSGVAESGGSAELIRRARDTYIPIMITPSRGEMVNSMNTLACDAGELSTRWCERNCGSESRKGAGDGERQRRSKQASAEVSF